jgi:hypothetical protein
MILTGSWGKTQTMLTELARAHVYRQAFDQAAAKEAHRLRGLMIEAFNKGGPEGARWPPLAAITQLMSRAVGRGDRHPLLYHGDLRNSIMVVNEGSVWFVGTHRRAKARDGKSMVNLAMVHNYGTRNYTVTVTPKMRKFFLWLWFQTNGQIMPLKASTTHLKIQIPPRPWIEPIWDREEDQSAKNITRDIATYIATRLP